MAQNFESERPVGLLTPPDFLFNEEMPGYGILVVDNLYLPCRIRKGKASPIIVEGHPLSYINSPDLDAEYRSWVSLHNQQFIDEEL